jgi:hypothetical protein
MTASLWLAACLGCAQAGSNAQQPASKPDPTPARPAASKVVSVTLYQGQALVTREVQVPEGEGVVELVVSPLPAQIVENSLYTEGADGVRVLSTRHRSRAVKEDTRQEVRAKEALVKKLESEARALQDEVAARAADRQYVQKLEGFTAGSLTNLTKEGRLDSQAVVSLSKFLMQTRGEASKAETELRQRQMENAEATALARKQLSELSAGPSRIEHDALIVVSKGRPAAATVRLGYLVGAATWTPQYRLRGGADDAPVRLEYLAAVVQQTGEDWPDVKVTLSTSRPSLDASPPELLPLNLAIAGQGEEGPIEGTDERSRKISARLTASLAMSFPNETPLEDVLKYIREATKAPELPDGIPIYVDPLGLQEAEKTMVSPVSFDAKDVPLRTSLSLMLKQLGLAYRVKDGLLMIVSQDSLDEERVRDMIPPGMAGMGGMGGMGGGFGGMVLEKVQAGEAAQLNQAAARGQSAELRVAENKDKAGAEPEPAAQGGPSVTFSIPGPLDIPSRRDPQLLEVARIELPAEYSAKAIPVLTPHVFRLAKLTNRSDLVLLPGEATVYVGGDFVGRMRLPLVAAGEPFLAGFGVDPQLQVSRRLVRKTRTVQGGNQVFEYEFRIGLRNYRKRPVTVQLWDRLPRPQGESVAVNLVKTSQELSADAAYQRTGRLDNLLRWDVNVPEGTVGDKAIYITYQFRLEYAKDLPQPRFTSGGLGEAPIGGGAMGLGGMGGMGGMRSAGPGLQ